MDLIILAMDNVIFSRSGLIVDYNKFNFKHIPRIKKKKMDGGELFYYSRDIQHKILNDILKNAAKC
ncbi:hypothetical protein [Escherichia coli]|uniref:hypothetical protein n=1 Tax=Escherichia coli TaxID=562 RepID=UPI00202F6240|nr:hypothetical protein [Escherichia coli]